MVVSLFSCKNQNNKNEDKAISMNEVDETANELEKKIKKGSITAYQTYGIACLDDKQFGDYYKMSKIMADKYDYTPAYYNVFSSFAEKVNDYFKDDKYNLDSLSISDKEEAIKYLKIGAEKGEEQCQSRIKSYIEEKRYFVASDTLIFNKKKK